jgi:hypothetical protein
MRANCHFTPAGRYKTMSQLWLRQAAVVKNGLQASVVRKGLFWVTMAPPSVDDLAVDWTFRRKLRKYNHLRTAKSTAKSTASWRWTWRPTKAGGVL